MLLILRTLVCAACLLKVGVEFAFLHGTRDGFVWRVRDATWQRLTRVRVDASPAATGGRAASALSAGHSGPRSTGCELLSGARAPAWRRFRAWQKRKRAKKGRIGFQSKGGVESGHQERVACLTKTM